ncbi:MAG: SCP2 sterol-binding domain-containing protein [Candidatus Freyarchaeota archaeon]|nr:SCP2 sterol-binding domain-containing protein [Candidatus Jordarchaeia archaeon]MBS7270155.1 SCP2 sterol-binding domain-containing protein [Candidatus Jordarchaeia archaeon]MBS7280873.1 SCP2 sterol-binding domain-containing protein [Candidatus Jordarchaeia archaeon]
MGIKEELLEALGEWARKLNDPSYKERFKGFNKVLQLNFTDTDFSLLMEFKDETCTVKEGSVEKPDVLIETDSEVILGICDGEISPTKAFMGGKLKAKGDMKDMLKIQMLMK